jgi:hypothetical protein
MSAMSGKGTRCLHLFGSNVFVGQVMALDSRFFSVILNTKTNSFGLGLKQGYKSINDI